VCWRLVPHILESGVLVKSSKLSLYCCGYIYVFFKLLVHVVMVYPHVICVNSSIGHGAQKNDLGGDRVDEVYDLLGGGSKGLAMLVLDDSCITQIHSKGVTHPAKALLDEIRGFSRLV
jgi:hypothetical protein